MLLDVLPKSKSLQLVTTLCCPTLLLITAICFALIFASLDIHIDEWLYELNIVMSSNTIYVQYSSYNALRHIAQKANIGPAAQPLEACKGIVVVFLTSVTSFLLKEKQILLIVHVSLP